MKTTRYIHLFLIFNLIFYVGSKYSFAVDPRGSNGINQPYPKPKYLSKNLGEDSFYASEQVLVVSDGVGSTRFTSKYIADLLVNTMAHSVNKIKLDNSKDEENFAESSEDLLYSMLQEYKETVAEGFADFSNILLFNYFNKDFKKNRILLNASRDHIQDHLFMSSSTIAGCYLIEQDSGSPKLKVFQVGDSLLLKLKQLPANNSGEFYYYPEFITDDMQKQFNTPSTVSSADVDFEGRSLPLEFTILDKNFKEKLINSIFKANFRMKLKEFDAPVKESDIIVLGSDGLFDNLSIPLIAIMINFILKKLEVHENTKSKASIVPEDLLDELVDELVILNQIMGDDFYAVEYIQQAKDHAFEMKLLDQFKVPKCHMGNILNAARSFLRSTPSKATTKVLNEKLESHLTEALPKCKAAQLSREDLSTELLLQQKPDQYRHENSIEIQHIINKTELLNSLETRKTLMDDTNRFKSIGKTVLELIQKKYNLVQRSYNSDNSYSTERKLFRNFYTTPDAISFKNKEKSQLKFIESNIKDDFNNHFIRRNSNLVLETKKNLFERTESETTEKHDHSPALDYYQQPYSYVSSDSKEAQLPIRKPETKYEKESTPSTYNSSLVSDINNEHEEASKLTPSRYERENEALNLPDPALVSLANICKPLCFGINTATPLRPNDRSRQVPLKKASKKNNQNSRKSSEIGGTNSMRAGTTNNDYFKAPPLHYRINFAIKERDPFNNKEVSFEQSDSQYSESRSDDGNGLFDGYLLRTNLCDFDDLMGSPKPTPVEHINMMPPNECVVNTLKSLSVKTNLLDKYGYGIIGKALISGINQLMNANIRISPFASKAMLYGKQMQGLKMDDITIIASAIKKKQKSAKTPSQTLKDIKKERVKLLQSLRKNVKDFLKNIAEDSTYVIDYLTKRGILPANESFDDVIKI